MYDQFKSQGTNVLTSGLYSPQSGEAQRGRAAGKNLLHFQARCFWWPFPAPVPHRRGAAGHQKICFIGMAIATTGIFTSHTHHRSPPHFPIWPHTHKGEAFPHTDPRQDPHPHIRTTYITHTPQTTTHRTPPLCPQRGGNDLY